MRVACITINAAMLTALVWIHRIGRTNIRTLYFIDDLFCIFIQVLCWRIDVGMFINAFDMFLYNFLCMKTAFGLHLSTAAFNEVGVFFHRKIVRKGLWAELSSY